MVVKLVFPVRNYCEKKFDKMFDKTSKHLKKFIDIKHEEVCFYYSKNFTKPITMDKPTLHTVQKLPRHDGKSFYRKNLPYSYLTFLQI